MRLCVGVLLCLCATVFLVAFIIEWDAESSQARSERQVLYAPYLWPDGIVYWHLNQDTRSFGAWEEAEVVNTIEKAMTRWEELTCVRFKRLSSDRELLKSQLQDGSYVDIGNDTRCSATVGFIRGETTVVRLQPGYCRLEWVITHELGHTLGLIHTHQRTDRDDHILLLWDNVDEPEQFEKVSHSRNVVPFDLSSIMQFGPNTVSRDGGVSVVAQNMDLDFLMGQGREPSFYDLKAVNKAYRCSDRCKVPGLQCHNDGVLLANCSCLCPFGLAPPSCDTVSPALTQGCGGTYQLQDDRALVSRVFPRNDLPSNVTCAWLIKGPIGSRLRFKVKISNNPSDQSCSLAMEVRSNLLGQQGFKQCSGVLKRTATSNSVMLIARGKLNHRDVLSITVETLNRHRTALEDCSFEFGLCGWRVRGVRRGWRRRGAGDDKLGPPHDHTLGMEGRGHTLSLLLRKGTTSSVESSTLQLPEAVGCVVFWLYVSQAEAGGLLALTLQESSAMEAAAGDVMWTGKTKSMRPGKWQQISVNLTVEGSFRVTIRGQAHDMDCANGCGAVALDDVTILSKPCQTT